MQITAPVNAEFLLRAARAGMAFASTGLISVHTFAAGHSYLSYLDWENTPRDGIRWTLANPRPRLLLPFTHHGCADLRMVVAHADRTALNRLSLQCNGRLVQARLGALRRQGDYWVGIFRGVCRCGPTCHPSCTFTCHPNRFRGAPARESGSVTSH